MIKMSRHSALIAFITVIMLLAGCSGGGSGGSDSGNSAPTAHAGPDQFVPVQTPTLVTLDGNASADSDGTIVSYMWEQVLRPGDPVVNLTNGDRATASFVASEVTDLLMFRLIVTDNEGATASDEVSVSVANVLFSDDFGNGDINAWMDHVVDDSSNLSDWQVVDEYVQQNVVESINSFEQSYHLGTYSYLNSGFDWTNYRLSVEVTPLPNNTADADRSKGNDVGVIFRYNTSDDNYYRLTLNSRYGFSRLEKRVAEKFYTLAVDSAGYYEGEMLNITIELNDSLIQVFLNDDPLFSVFDSDINSGTIALYCQDKAKFDNVLVTENSPVPTVVISSPVAYSIATTDIDTLDVSAIATNVPSGGKVEFVLDDTESIESSESSSHYTAEFTGVSRGEHTVHAILRDDSGTELARDTNVQIGVLGDYYVAIGDSITNGIGDADPSDNTSQDGRIIAIQGFEANLNDLLTSTRDYPHIVFNEGIGGDTSAKALGRIESILDRHPESNKVLILLGTNDAGAGVVSEDFRTTMQNLINMVPEDKDVWVALVPPIFDEDGIPDDDRNPLVEDYNEVINQLDDIQVGPDLYDFFSTRPFLFADKLHPNARGYEAMAYLWHNELNRDNPLALPSYLDNL